VHRPIRARLAILCSALLAAPSSIGATAILSSLQEARGNVPSFQHIFVVVMENLGYNSALGTPGFAALANQYALATQYYATAHPSLPNYLAMTSGSTWGVTSDCTDCLINEPNIALQLADAHITFGAYMEGVPSACYLAPYGGFDYAGKHDPFRYYIDVRSSHNLCSRIEPESRLPKLLSGPAKNVPRFVWVTPDLCHDGHDCAPTVAANWLSRFVAQITKSAAWRDHGVLFVTWDESNGDSSEVVSPGRVIACCGGGRVATFVIAPNVRMGTRVAVPYNHYSLLATIEDAFSLPLLANAKQATPLSAFFRGTNVRSSG
jgi:phosphatidylinositol-3-phosphatase